MSLAGSFISFVYFDGYELLLNTEMEIKLKKWGCLKRLFCGNAERLRQFKKYIVIILPILYSIVDSYSDANYCFGIASGEGIFNIGRPEDFGFDGLLVGQKIMLVWLFLGEFNFLSDIYLSLYLRSIQRSFVGLVDIEICQ